MKTPAQRQADRRARLAACELVEVRGIYLPPELHPALKREAAKLSPLASTPARGKEPLNATEGTRTHREPSAKSHESGMSPYPDGEAQ